MTYFLVVVFKKVLIILRKSTKHANFWLGVQYHLKDIMLLAVPCINHFQRGERYMVSFPVSRFLVQSRQCVFCGKIKRPKFPF